MNAFRRWMLVTFIVAALLCFAAVFAMIGRLQAWGLNDPEGTARRTLAAVLGSASIIGALYPQRYRLFVSPVRGSFTPLGRWIAVRFNLAEDELLRQTKFPWVTSLITALVLILLGFLS